MKPVNEKFRDFLLKHSHYRARLETGTICEMFKPYKAVKTDLLRMLTDAEKWTGYSREFRITRLRAQLAEVQGVLSACGAEAAGTLQKTLTDLVFSESDTYYEMLAAQYNPIGINLVRLPYRQIDWIVNNPLIYQYRNITIEDALSIWNNEAAVDLMRQQLTQSVILGEDMARAARRLVKPGDAYGTAEKIIRNRAMVIARSEIQHVSNQTARAIFHENQDVLKGCVHVSTLDRRTCMRCMSLDGHFYPFRDGIMSAPLLPLHPLGRCVHSPVTKSWKELGAMTDKKVPKDYFSGKPFKPVTYDMWLRGLHPDDAKDLLGPKRYQMWADGKIKLSQMANQNTIFTIEQLEEKARKILKLTGAKPAVNPMSVVGRLANCIVLGKIKESEIIEMGGTDPCKDYVHVGKDWYFQGRKITGEILQKLDKMRLPPAWTNVVVSTDVTAKIQAVGLDKAGRWQYRYSSAHTAKAAQKKFNRVKSFSRDMPLIRKQIKKGVAGKDSRALLLRLEDKTAIRAGSVADFKAKKKAYGLTTLQHEHVQISGNKVVLDFVAKKGIPAHYEFVDETLALWLGERKSVTFVGERLFPNISASKLNTYLKKISGKDYTIKDFRTYHGTRIAFEQLNKYAGETLTVKEKKKIIKMVSEKVGAFLANTPATAKNSYINPVVWDFINVK